MTRAQHIKLAMALLGTFIICSVGTLTGYVLGNHHGIAFEKAIAPLEQTLSIGDANEQKDAIARAIPGLIKQAGGNKDALLWAVFVTQSPELSKEHQAALFAYCHADESFLAELAMWLFAAGYKPECGALNSSPAGRE